MLRLAALAVLLAGCPGPTCEVGGWSAVAQKSDGAMLSVQGTASDDVWVAGGGLGVGGAVLRHWDGDAWTNIAIDDARSLWWVTPDGRGRAWAVGEGGLIVHVVDGVATTVDSGTDVTLYGVWDGWVVGENDTMLRYDGNVFAPVTIPDRNVRLFKVWGAAADDVWATGERGTILHWDGAAWSDQSVVSPLPLTTVWGCSAGDVWAVGAQRAYENTGDGWTQLADFPTVVNGVSCAAGTVLFVGNAGMRIRLEDGAMIDDTLDGPLTDYHGAWVDETGSDWAAGGNFNTPAPDVRQGVLAHRGCPKPAGF